MLQVRYFTQLTICLWATIKVLIHHTVTPHKTLKYHTTSMISQPAQLPRSAECDALTVGCNQGAHHHTNCSTIRCITERVTHACHVGASLNLWLNTVSCCTMLQVNHQSSARTFLEIVERPGAFSARLAAQSHGQPLATDSESTWNNSEFKQ